MDAATLAKRKSALKRHASQDRSAPLVDDAAHPGSAGVLRAISVGRFELKHVQTEHDASKPMIEKGTGFHTDARPALFAEVAQSGRRASLKATKTNDRSDPLIEKWVHIDVMHKPARACVVDELKSKKASIEALHTYNEHHTKEEMEKHTRPGAHDHPTLPPILNNSLLRGILVARRLTVLVFF